MAEEVGSRERGGHGVAGETILALDFVHFGNNLTDVNKLSEQLSESYEMTISQRNNENYWFINGTTRPYGITPSKENHLSWVVFMCDVARPGQARYR
jgi:hypothetical protein